MVSSLFRTLQSRADTKVPCARNSSANARDHGVWRSRRSTALAGRCGLLGRGRTLGRWPSGRCLAAKPAALLRRGVRFRLTAAGTAFLSAAAFLVHCCPSYALGFFLGHATRFVTFGDVIRFAFLFSGVFRFVAARHHHSPVHLIACRFRASPSKAATGKGRG